MSKGSAFYGDWGPYKSLARRESYLQLGKGSLSVISDALTGENGNDGISSLNQKQIMAIQGYLELFQKKYTFLGYHKGIFFDKEGRPTVNYEEYARRVKEERENSK